jgi:hypothetical protein
MNLIFQSHCPTNRNSKESQIETIPTTLMRWRNTIHIHSPNSPSVFHVFSWMSSDGIQESHDTWKDLLSATRCSESRQTQKMPTYKSSKRG